MINEKKLDFWLQNNLNVLVTGEHGVGKTAIIEETFQRNGLNMFDIDTFDLEENQDQMYYLYFSASTMDPFVDLIGVPRERTKDMKDGTKFTYLDLLRPLPLALDRIGAIFMDELNRADPKVRNAVMEIVQFKSINGKKFHNLRVIWGAINPETKEKTYDVERLDPAQVDRFHIHTEVDFKPDVGYFHRKFGEEQAKVALDWWNGITADMKTLCSPRRLDYAITIHNMGGSVRDVINKKLSVKKLEETLQNGLAREKLARLLDQKKYAEAEAFLSVKNVYQEIEPWFIENKDSAKYAADIFRLMNAEFMAKVVSEQRKNTELLKPLFAQYYQHDKIMDTLGTLARTTTDRDLQAVISQNIPLLNNPDIGTNPMGFTPTASSNKTFSTMVANWSTNSLWQQLDKHDEIIKELQKAPVDLNQADAIGIVTVMGGLLKQATSKVLHERKIEILGPLNHALKFLNLNMLTTPKYKFEINKLVKYKLHQHLWIPTNEK